MTEVASKETGTQKTASPKVGYAIAAILGLVIVLLISFYFIYNGLNHAGRWVRLYPGYVQQDYFNNYEFAVFHNDDEANELLRYIESGIDRYRINTASYDYLLVGFIQECSSRDINQARVNDITEDGVAKIYIGYGAADPFSSGSCYEAKRFVLFEGKKGSFDSIKKLEFSGAKRLDIGAEPEIDYIAEASFIGYANEQGYDSKSMIFTNYDDIMALFAGIAEPDIKVPFTAADFVSSDYLYIPISDNGCSNRIVNVGLTGIEHYVANVVIEERNLCGVCAPSTLMYVIPVEKGSVSQISTRHETVGRQKCTGYDIKKPVIYLYPEERTNVSVKLGAPEKLVVSYPAYRDGWNVIAQPNGDLQDIATGRELYSLYYEAENTTSRGVRETGFVVRGEETAAFLEAKLAQLGLTEREAEEFIIYWLPQMQNNAYNYIYFATGEEVAKNMPLEVSPAPKTTIRINMEWKALDAPITVKPQTLPATPLRDGFTLVEWGGTIL